MPSSWEDLSEEETDADVQAEVRLPSPKRVKFTIVASPEEMSEEASGVSTTDEPRHEDDGIQTPLRGPRKGRKKRDWVWTLGPLDEGKAVPVTTDELAEPNMEQHAQTPIREAANPPEPSSPQDLPLPLSPSDDDDSSVDPDLTSPSP